MSHLSTRCEVRSNLDMIAKALHLILEPGQVTELRALGVTMPSYRAPHSVSGYFDNVETLASAAAQIDNAKGVYFVPNLVNPSLLARAANRVRVAGKGDPLTGDGDIIFRRWLFIDCDPVRPAGISSTDAEHGAARNRACCVYAALRDEGWPEPVEADSGNGFHLLYRIELQANDGGLVQRCLKSIASRFDDDKVTIDRTVHNPGRIWKVYGTVARKGDSTVDRPHRLAGIVKAPEKLEAVSRELLEARANKDADGNQAAPDGFHQAKGVSSFDLAAWIQRHSLDVEGPKDWRPVEGQHGRRWVFRRCPWDSNHTDRSAYIVQLAEGAIAAGCHHSSCTGKGWGELRDTVEPGWRNQHFGLKICTEQVTEEPPWERPVPLLLNQERPRFPVNDAFPAALAPIREFLDAVAESLQVPVDIPAMLLLPVTAVAIAQKAEIELTPGWREPAALWTLTLAPSGERKSAAVRIMLAPLHCWEREEAARLLPLIAEQQERRKIKESHLAALRKSAGKAARLQDGDVRQAVELAKELQAETILCAPQLQTAEPTTEAVAGLLVSNQERLLVASSESDALDVILGRYNRQTPNFGMWLSGHAGDTYRIDRRGRDPDHVNRPALSVALAVQPDAVMDLFASRQARGRGLIARFLKCFPGSMLGRRKIDTSPVPEALVSAYNGAIRRLLDWPIDQGGPAIVTLSSEAAGLFHDLRGKIESELGRHGDLANSSDWGGKLCGAVARIALVLHGLAEWGNSAHSAHSALTLSAETMTAALGWVPYLVDHEKVVCRMVGTDLAVSVADRVLRWLERTGQDRFSRRAAFAACRAGDVQKTQDIDPALGLLVEYAYIRLCGNPDRGGAGRKPSPEYLVNPAWVREGRR